MNWKRGLTRIYVTLWVLFALAGIAVVFSLSSSWSEDATSVWVSFAWWTVICLAMPAGLLQVIKWIAVGFARSEQVPGVQPEPPRGGIVVTSVQSAATVPGSSRLQFTGKGGDIFSREGRKMCLWYVSIVGIPMGWLYTYRWATRNTILPSGMRVSFAGTAGQAYGFFVASIALAILKRLDLTKALGDTPALVFTVAVLWTLGLLVGQGLVYLAQFKWVLDNLVFTPSTRVSFKGRVLPYIGWTILTVLAFFTVVGWAWATTAFLRWQMRNTDMPGHRLRFRGKGLDLLWRGIVAFCGCLVILPIPWIIGWLGSWMANNTEMESLTEASAGERSAAAA